MNKSTYSRRKEFKKVLINNQTFAEVKIHKALKDSGIEYHRQYIITPYIVDLFLPWKRLVIEIDGSIHNNKWQQEKDSKKELYIFSFGLFILRYENNHDIDLILSDVGKFKNIDKQLFNIIHRRISYISGLYGTVGFNGKTLDFNHPSHKNDVKRELRAQLRKKDNRYFRMKNKKRT